MSICLRPYKELKKALITEDINLRYGLPEDLFLLVSSLVPITNIDLFVVNKKREMLIFGGLMSSLDVGGI